MTRAEAAQQQIALVRVLSVVISGSSPSPPTSLQKPNPSAARKATPLTLHLHGLGERHTNKPLAAAWHKERVLRRRC